jgi:hypothetical protein
VKRPLGSPRFRKREFRAELIGDPPHDLVLHVDASVSPDRLIGSAARSTLGAEARLTAISASQAVRLLSSVERSHERELDRPLDLEGVGTGKEHDRSRVDAPDRPARSERLRIGKK